MNVARAPVGDDDTGCYVHLPFCDRICPYCDFAVVGFEATKAARYVAAVEAEIRATPRPERPVRTLYLGGGTPSALALDDVARVLRAAFETFAVAPGSIECTIEANPSRSVADLAAWHAAGVTRVSIGMQSLDDGELHRLGRDHTGADAVAFVRAARAAGFQDISVDLITGVPGQSAESFARSLAAVVALRPEHVSVYGLTVEPATPYATWFARQPAAFPDDDAVADLLNAAHDALTGAGYDHYELSNFALSGHECAHNIGYWRQRDCLAFGLSASGYQNGERYRNVRDLAEYCVAIERGRSPREEVERLDAARRIGEAAMLALRTREGIDRDDFRRRFHIDVGAAFEHALKKCSTAGLLETDAMGARLTGRGRLLANSVCAEFLDPQLSEASSRA